MTTCYLQLLQQLIVHMVCYYFDTRALGLFSKGNYKSPNEIIVAGCPSSKWFSLFLMSFFSIYMLYDMKKNLRVPIYRQSYPTLSRVDMMVKSMHSLSNTQEIFAEVNTVNVIVFSLVQIVLLFCQTQTVTNQITLLVKKVINQIGQSIVFFL